MKESMLSHVLNRVLKWRLLCLEWVRFLDYSFVPNRVRISNPRRRPNTQTWTKYPPPLPAGKAVPSWVVRFRVTSPPGRLATRKLAIKSHLVASGDFSEDFEHIIEETFDTFNSSLHSANLCA